MAEQLEVVKTHINQFLHKHPDIEEHVEKAAAKIGVEKAFVVMGAIAIPVFLMFAVGSTTLIIDAVGFGYPMYETLKALETPGTDDDTQWLTYWLIFSMFKITESLLGVLLNMIPFYYFIKVAFLVWCYYPTIKGASTVYSAVIKPYVVPALGLQDYAASVTPKTLKPSTYKILCNVKSLTVVNNATAKENEKPLEKSVQCVLTAVPSLDRLAEKSDIENIPFSSQTMMMSLPTPESGKGCEAIPVHHKLVLKPITHLDGFIKIDLVEKSTFGSNFDHTKNLIGSVEIPVSSITKDESVRLVKELLHKPTELLDYDMKLNLQFELTEEKV